MKDDGGKAHKRSDYHAYQDRPPSGRSFAAREDVEGCGQGRAQAEST